MRHEEEEEGGEERNRGTRRRRGEAQVEGGRCVESYGFKLFMNSFNRFLRLSCFLGFYVGSGNQR